MEAVCVCRFRKAEVQKLSESLSFNAGFARFRIGSPNSRRGVSSAPYAPMSGDQWGHDVRIQGKPEPGPKDDVSSDWTRITPGFFDTIGAPHNLGSGTAP